MTTERLRRYAYISVGALGGGALVYILLKYALLPTLPFLIAWAIAFALRTPSAYLSSKIKIENVDPALNPAFLTGDKSTVESGSIIVESAKRNKVIKNIEIYYPGVSMEQLESYYMQYQNSMKIRKCEKN